MNNEEKIAERYLERLGLGSPIFEPDGNIAPDFAFPVHQIAIEVRRLNRILSPGGNLTEENIYIPLWRNLKKYFAKYDSQFGNQSYLLLIDYVTPHPLPKISGKDIFEKVKRIHISRRKKFPFVLKLGDGLFLRVLKMPPIEGRTFILASMHYEHRDIQNEYLNSLKWCIAEKTNKIKLHKHKYLKWQLLLVDMMRWDLDNSEIEALKDSITDLGLFDCLTVIDYEANFIFKK